MGVTDRITPGYRLSLEAQFPRLPPSGWLGLEAQFPRLPAPGRPGSASGPGTPDRPQSPAMSPPGVWIEQGEWPGRLYERLLDHRIVMAHGFLDGAAATRLSAQLLTLDAEGRDAIRLEIQNLEADLGAALTVMGVLDTLRSPVTARAGGRISGPALGILAAADHRRAYPSALLALAEPRVSFEGTADAVATHEEQTRGMLDNLYDRLASVTGRDVAAIRADARSQRVLTAEQAIGYGLVEDLVTPSGEGLPSGARG
jgi:ATP-dependent Clp protease protease subunit